MEAQRLKFEHPLVTRVNNLLNPPHSPVQNIKDFFQPSHGCLYRNESLMKYQKEYTTLTFNQHLLD